MDDVEITDVDENGDALPEADAEELKRQQPPRELSSVGLLGKRRAVLQRERTRLPPGTLKKNTRRLVLIDVDPSVPSSSLRQWESASDRHSSKLARLAC